MTNNKGENSIIKEDRIMYGVIDIDYNRRWILPVDDAVELLKMISRSRLMKKEYNKPLEILEVDPVVSLKLMSEQQLKEQILEASLESDDS